MNNQDRLESLKWREYNTFGVADINFLEKMGIINGIGPETYGWLFRYIMTWLFGSILDYKIHDVMFWQQKGFHDANRGLIKFSYIAIAKDYVAICKTVWYKRIPLKIIHFITAPFKTIIIDLAYSAVESNKGREAYKACKIL